MEEKKMSEGAKRYLGGCHCGAVRFAVTVDLGAGVGACNCSICTKINPRGAIVKPAAFELLAGDADVSMYEWGAKVSQRFFCKTCGVHCYGRGNLPELGGAYVSVNVNCLDDVEPSGLKVTHWDGRHDNWDAGPRDRPWPVGARAPA
jgi:hypothetical protein